MFIKIVFVSLLALGAIGCGGMEAAPASPPSPEELGLIPLPAVLTTRAGSFTLSSSARIAITPGVETVGEQLAAVLRPSTGFELAVVAGDPGTGDIALRIDDGSAAALGTEGYRLEVSSAGITVTAAAAAGLFYGCQTLRQLMPVAVERSSLASGVEWRVPELTIEDVPRFEWRGAMLDVARHFFDVVEVERYIDLIAYHKMNRLHLHLTDDQGWRVEIKSWPNLTAIGGSTEVGGGEGGFYTQADIATIVDHAAARFVTVVPEIDMPGHINAALASYGELNPDGMPAAPYTGTDVGFSSLWLDGPVTATFVTDVIGEVAALFPSPYFHIGGDEAKMTAEMDYISFIEDVQTTVAAKGKTLIGWEEIGSATLDAPFYAQYWLADAKARAARDGGARIISSPVVFAYLDIKYDGETPIGQTYVGFTDVQKAYSWDPVMAGLTDADVVGLEAPLWTETVATRADIDLLAFPRLAGHAEVAWSPKQGRTWETYRMRLSRHGERLDALGVGFYRSSLVDWH